MSYIPDTRTKFTISPYKKNQEEVKSPNCYYEKLLPKQMKEYVDEFDTNLNHTLSYFDNLDVYEDEFNEVGIDIDSINLNAITDEKKDLTNESLLTKKFNVIYQTMKDYLMEERNELIVGLIDSIEEDTPEYDEYKQNYKDLFGEDEYKKEFETEYIPEE